MVLIVATRGVATKLRSSPFTETVIVGVHSVVYRPGVEPVPEDGTDAAAAANGTFTRGVQRIPGVLFAYDGSAAEALFALTAGIDLVIRYRASGEKRVRTLGDVIFVGDAVVTFPAAGGGALPGLVGVPFRVQIPEGETLSEHVTDEAEA